MPHYLTVRGSTDVVVTDPDSPYGSPAYEGPIEDSHNLLDAGTYEAVVQDGLDADLPAYATVTFRVNSFTPFVEILSVTVEVAA